MFLIFAVLNRLLKLVTTDGNMLGHYINIYWVTLDSVVKSFYNN
jgi:hypothetical protein